MNIKCLFIHIYFGLMIHVSITGPAQRLAPLDGFDPWPNGHNQVNAIGLHFVNLR